MKLSAIIALGDRNRHRRRNARDVGNPNGESVRREPGEGNVPRAWLVVVCLLAAGAPKVVAQNVDRVTPRVPQTLAERNHWLENMIGWHHYAVEEAAAALGLGPSEIEKALEALRIKAHPWIEKPPGAPIRVLPYPGGRHPRIGFRDGAIDPQRETKVSVFPPWAKGGYVVVDVPEAIWSNLGLTYLAHTHVDTIWTKRKVQLEPTEWQVLLSGELQSKRRLPNGIAFSTTVRSEPDAVDFSMTLTNGTDKLLSDLRVQVCLMLKMATGFEDQTNANKKFIGDYAACHDKTGTRWIVVSFRPKHRTWGNTKCPCLHADPKFPDCSPGQTVNLAGRMTFYEGKTIEPEIARLERMRSTAAWHR